MIEVKNLTKRYGSHTAVSNLSFHIETGQIYGFLGPNGAGKSTTMNIMTGCLAATEGEVTVGGYDIFEDAAQAKRRIGYLPERPPLYLDRTPLEYLAFVGQAKGLTGSALEEQMRRVMAVTQIESVSNRLIKNLSKGYQQRVGIAQALLGDPEVVILDEPTVGLDPKQIMEIVQNYQISGEEEPYKKAIKECIEKGILADYLMRKGSEVVNMLLDEYDYETDIEVQREEAREEGRKLGREEGREEEKSSLIRKKLEKGKTISEIADDLEDTEENIVHLIKEFHLGRKES